MATARPGISRRWFLRALAFLPALPVGGWARRAASQVPAPKATASIASPAPDAAAPAPPEISPDVEHLSAILQRRYGNFLTLQQVKAMAPDLNRQVLIGERLRKAALTNSDEPDFVFSIRTGK